MRPASGRGTTFPLSNRRAFACLRKAIDGHFDLVPPRSCWSEEWSGWVLVADVTENEFKRYEPFLRVGNQHGSKRRLRPWLHPHGAAIPDTNAVTYRR